METIVIDAGHGGYDSGATYEGRREKDDNLKLALAVGNELEQAGYQVIYTRTTDVFDSPIEKARKANESGADYFVSFHRNAGVNPGRYNGVQTLVYDDSGIKSEMARNVNKELEDLGFRNLGVDVRPNLVVLRRTGMPAILIEAGFIDSDVDNKLFDEKFNEIAKGIASGIEETIGTDTNQTIEHDEMPSYRIQVGLFRRYENASNLLKELQQKGYEAEITQWNGYYAVQAGNTRNLNAARKLQNSLRTQGYETLLVTV